MLQKIKRTFYIFCFTILGALFGLLVAAWFDLWWLNRHTTDFNSGASWGAVLVLALLGFWAGEYWWEQIYVLNKRWWLKK